MMHACCSWQHGSVQRVPYSNSDQAHVRYSTIRWCGLFVKSSLFGTHLHLVEVFLYVLMEAFGYLQSPYPRIRHLGFCALMAEGTFFLQFRYPCCQNIQCSVFSERYKVPKKKICARQNPHISSFQDTVTMYNRSLLPDDQIFEWILFHQRCLSWPPPRSAQVERQDKRIPPGPGYQPLPGPGRAMGHTPPDRPWYSTQTGLWFLSVENHLILLLSSRKNLWVPQKCS